MAVAFLFFVGFSQASADTHVSNSCSLTDVQAAVNNSSDGDTVIILRIGDCQSEKLRPVNVGNKRIDIIFTGADASASLPGEAKEDFVALIFPGFLIFSFIFFKIFSALQGGTQKKIILQAVNFSPVWIPAALIFVIFRTEALMNGKFNFFLEITTFIILYFLAFLYYIMSAWPAASAFTLIDIFNEKSKDERRRQTVTVWSMLDRIKKERIFIISILLVLLVIFFSFDIYLLFKIEPTLVLLVISLGVLFFYMFFKFFSYGNVKIPTIDHEKLNNLQRAIDKVSIATGVKAPNFKILSHTNPTAFSIYPNFGKPTIFITATLLNMADDNELEAVIAHEFSQIYSGRLLYLKRVNNLLIILKTVGFFMFFLALCAINQELIFLWLALLAIATLNPSNDRDMVSGEKGSIAIANASALNPPYSLINFISYLIYYSIAYNEEYYADIKAVEITRYPKSIYSIIQKIENYDGVKDKLPKKYEYLYFTGQGTIFDEIPMATPTVENRKENLEEIDELLAEDKSPEKNAKLKCPRCQNLMGKITAASLDNNPVRENYCEKCDAVWFDGWIFWGVGDLEEEHLGKSKLKIPEEIEIKNEEKLICPRCGVDLEFYIDPTLPKDVKIWSCPTCNGNWLSRKSALNYVVYHKARLKARDEEGKRSMFY